MRRQLAHVQRKMESARRALGRARLAGLPGELQRHAETGVAPTNPLAKSYIALTEAALTAMDASIGGSGYAGACEAYQQRLAEWHQQLKDSGI